MGLLRGRDLLVLCVVLTTIYLYSFRAVPWGSSLRLEPSWFIELAKGKGPASSASMPALFHMDGHQMVGFIDKDSRLKVFRLSSVLEEDSKEIYHPEEVALPGHPAGAVLGFHANNDSIVSITTDLVVTATGKHAWTARLPALASGTVRQASLTASGTALFIGLLLTATEEVQVTALRLSSGEVLWTRMTTPVSPPSATDPNPNPNPAAPLTAFVPHITAHPLALSPAVSSASAAGAGDRAGFLAAGALPWAHPRGGGGSHTPLLSLASFHRGGGRGRGAKGEDNALLLRTSSGVAALGLRDGTLASSLHLLGSASNSSSDGASIYCALLRHRRRGGRSRKRDRNEGLGSAAGCVRLEGCSMKVTAGLSPASAHALFAGDICSGTSTPSGVLALALPHHQQLLVATAEGVLSLWDTLSGALKAKVTSSPRWAGTPEVVPTLTAFSAISSSTPEEVPSHVLLGGAARLAVMSLDHLGISLAPTASVQLPHPLQQPALIRDFDGDGYADIVLTTSEEVLGLRIVHTSSEALVGSLLALGLCVALLVLLLHVQREQGTGVGGAGTGIGMTVRRSTDDDQHAD